MQTMLCVGKLGWTELDQIETSWLTEILVPGPRDAVMEGFRKPKLFTDVLNYCSEVRNNHTLISMYR